MQSIDCDRDRLIATIIHVNEHEYFQNWILTIYVANYCMVRSTLQSECLVAVVGIEFYGIHP